MSGDKRALLGLGNRFEEGRGVSVDIGGAMSLYRDAPADNGRVALVQIPASRDGGRSTTVPLNQGVGEPGLVAAKQRLSSFNNLSRFEINKESLRWIRLKISNEDTNSRCTYFFFKINYVCSFVSNQDFDNFGLQRHVELWKYGNIISSFEKGIYCTSEVFLFESGKNVVLTYISHNATKNTFILVGLFDKNRNDIGVIFGLIDNSIAIYVSYLYRKNVSKSDVDYVKNISNMQFVARQGICDACQFGGAGGRSNGGEGEVGQLPISLLKAPE